MNASNAPDSAGPLTGVKVVDLTRALSGPTCTMILADMGAETVRIDQPPKRGKGRSAESPAPPHPQFTDRNKKSITLDLHFKERNRFVGYEFLGKMFPMIAPFPPTVEDPGGRADPLACSRPA